MRISWVTYGTVAEGADGVAASALASIRYRVLSPIRRLPQHRHRVATITPETHPLPWDEVLDADRLIFSKSLAASNEALARRARALRVPVIFDVCDDHFASPDLGAHYRTMAALADQVICNTPEMARAAAPHAAAPPIVIEDPYEGPRGAPTFAPGARLDLLWFGHPLGLEALRASLGEVVDYAQDRPVSLTILTELNPALEAECARATASLAPNFRMSAQAWSLEAQWRALAACDAVLIPTAGQPAKSANRMVEALWAGRPVVAQPLPAYAPFANWTPVGPSLAEGLRRLEADRAALPGRIAEAQAFIAGRYAPDVIARQWADVIAATSPA
jgi:hypothetical protein